MSPTSNRDRVMLLPARPPARPPAWLAAWLAAWMAAALGAAALAGCEGSRVTTGGLTAEQHRQLGAKLQAAGVVGAAAAEYGAFLDAGGGEDAAARAGVALQVGRMLVEAGRLEEALAWLYRVELLDPGGKHQAEAGTAIVSCLERLGRHAEASRALGARTSREGAAGAPVEGQAGDVVARVGGEAITRGQVDAAWDAIPDPMRPPAGDQEARRAFARQYVAQEVLYRKAAKEGVDQEPRVVRHAEELRRAAVVTELVRRRVQAELRVDEADVRNWFEARKRAFAPEGQPPPAYEQVRDHAVQAYAREKQERIAAGVFDEALAGGEVEILAPDLKAPPAPPPGPPGGAGAPAGGPGGSGPGPGPGSGAAAKVGSTGGAAAGASPGGAR